MRKMDNNLMDINQLIKAEKTEDIVSDLKNIIELSQKQAYQAINTALVYRNWLIGYRIAEEELKGEDRAEYGTTLIRKLSKELTNEYGKGYTKTNLYSFYSFYKMYPNIFHSVSGKSVPLLSWTQYRTLIQVKDEKARNWYEKEAAQQAWNVRTLQRNIASQYYYRLLKSQVKDPVVEEMKQLTSKYQYDKLEFIKNPEIAEFLSLPTDTSFTETEL